MLQRELPIAELPRRELPIAELPRRELSGAKLPRRELPIAYCKELPNYSQGIDKRNTSM
ncbi:MAG TPA: hypothetical protein PLY70_03270 [Saprospiraceae bacterium]|nr:hypothetical protein [Saprospiraceae bacterium]